MVSSAPVRRTLYRILFLRTPSRLPRTLPLGLISIAAYLRQRWGGDVAIQILDLRVHDKPIAQIRDEINAFRPDVIGVTALSLEARGAHEMLALARETCPDAVTLLGGPYPTATTEPRWHGRKTGPRAPRY